MIIKLVGINEFITLRMLKCVLETLDEYIILVVSSIQGLG